MSASAPLSISHLSTTESSPGRFHAALSPWLFRDAAGALEARIDSETTLTVPTKGSSPIVACARCDGQWGKAAGCSGTSSKQVLVAVGAGQETEKGPPT